MRSAFAPLTAGELESAPAPQAAEEWVHVVPVPDDVKREVPPHSHGKPSAFWPYRDSAGRLLFVACRFDPPGDRKAILPLTYCSAPGGRQAWQWKALPKPRPLYRLDALAARTEAPVIVVEGEKAADAAARLFPDHAATTSAGGAKAAALADWSPLVGRRVTVWPDNDEEGRAYAADVARLARAAGAEAVAVVSIPEGFPPKWDVADALPQGIAEADLRALLKNAEAAAANRDPATPDPALFYTADDRPAEANPAQGPRVNLVRGDTIQAEAITWLWPGYLAAGKLHVLAGPAGTGKTTVALSLGAAITAGSALPDGRRAPLGDVLIWSGEDGKADVLVPRLKASGADMARVYFVGDVEEGSGKRPFDPAADMPALLEVARKVPDLRLLIVDPLVSAVAGDSHKNAETRRGLQPLVDLGADLGCAILGITHYTKNSQGRDPLDRVTGSLAFGAVARLVLATVKPADPATPRRLVRAKSNLGPDGGGFEYDLQSVPVEDGPPTVFGQCIVWIKPLEGSARALLDEVEQTAGEGRADTALEAARDFLIERLKDGPMAVAVIQADARGAGCAWATVRRAKVALKVTTAKDGFDGGWRWSLPDGAEARRCSSNPEDAHPVGMSTFGELEHLRDETEWEADL